MPMIFLLEGDFFPYEDITTALLYPYLLELYMKFCAKAENILQLEKRNTAINDMLETIKKHANNLPHILFFLGLVGVDLETQENIQTKTKEFLALLESAKEGSLLGKLKLLWQNTPYPNKKVQLTGILLALTVVFFIYSSWCLLPTKQSDKTDLLAKFFILFLSLFGLVNIVGLQLLFLCVCWLDGQFSVEKATQQFRQLKDKLTSSAKSSGDKITEYIKNHLEENIKTAVNETFNGIFTSDEAGRLVQQFINELTKYVKDTFITADPLTQKRSVYMFKISMATANSATFPKTIHNLLNQDRNKYLPLLLRAACCLEERLPFIPAGRIQDGFLAALEYGVLSQNVDQVTSRRLHTTDGPFKCLMDIQTSHKTRLKSKHEWLEYCHAQLLILQTQIKENINGSDNLNSFFDQLPGEELKEKFISMFYNWLFEHDNFKQYVIDNPAHNYKALICDCLCSPLNLKEIVLQQINVKLNSVAHERTLISRHLERSDNKCEEYKRLSGIWDGLFIAADQLFAHQPCDTKKKNYSNLRNQHISKLLNRSDAPCITPASFQEQVLGLYGHLSYTPTCLESMSMLVRLFHPRRAPIDTAEVHEWESYLCRDLESYTSRNKKRETRTTREGLRDEITNHIRDTLGRDRPDLRVKLLELQLYLLQQTAKAKNSYVLSGDKNARLAKIINATHHKVSQALLRHQAPTHEEPTSGPAEYQGTCTEITSATHTSTYR
jgi:hypothetical protein